MKKIYHILNSKIQVNLKLEESGFQVKSFDDYYSIYFKKNKEVIDTLCYSFYPVSKSACFSMISYGIILPQINRVLKQVISNFYEYEYTLIDRAGSQLSQDLQKSIILEIVTNEEINETNLVNSCKLFNVYLDEYAYPFFNSITTLQQINDNILEKYDWKEWYKYISGLNGVHYLKSIIIMKLCNNEKGYKEFTEMYSQLVLDAINNGRTEVQDLYNTWKELLEYLESGKYLEIDNMVDGVAETIESNPTLAPKPKRDIPVLPQNTAVEQAFKKYEKEFNTLGIHFNKKITLNDYRNDLNWQSWKMEEPQNVDWKYFLLLFSGTKVYNTLSEVYEPVSPNVYYFNAEWDGFVDYGKIIQRLNLLTNNELPFTNIVCEEEGICTFEYKGKAHSWTFEIDGDWTDSSIFELFIDLVSADINKVFYIMFEGQGGIILYYDSEEYHKFESYFDKKLIRL
jgi:hypothetical protein